MSIRWWHRIRLPDGSYTPGEVRHGPDGGSWPETRFGLSRDLLLGKTVLDIGAWDGFFSFEAERLEALRVTATDCSQAEGGNWGGTAGFNEAKKQLNSDVEFKHLDITAPDPKVQPHDVVLFFGVLYHLTTPATGLRNAARLSNETLLIETACSFDRGEEPVLESRPGFDGDPTNYYYPNPAWIKWLMEDEGFSSEVIYDLGSRFTMRCTRNDKTKRTLPVYR